MTAKGWRARAYAGYARENDLQDANTRLGVELKDVRAQLADSVKENKRLRRGIFSKCLNKLL